MSKQTEYTTYKGVSFELDESSELMKNKKGEITGFWLYYREGEKIYKEQAIVTYYGPTPGRKVRIKENQIPEGIVADQLFKDRLN